jgi:hypothetical protein
MYLLIAANTLDDDIGATCEVDRKGTEKLFTELADFMGIPLIKKSIYDKEYTKANVEVALQSLNPSPKDIVVFYYSGHGFSQQDQRLYPYISLTSKISESAVANSLNMEDIFNRIKNKGARFNLVLSDCCNTPIGNPGIIVPVEYAKTRSSQVGWDLDNCKSLFLNPKPTSIMMTAASRDEYSCGIRDGGLFTLTLRAALADYFSKLRNNVTWGEVLADVKNQTIKRADHTARADKGPDGNNLRCKQHPIFQILVN